MSFKDESKQTDTVLVSGKRLAITWGAEGQPQRIYPLDVRGIKDGLALEYSEQGALCTITTWKDGIQDGHAFIIEEGKLATHQIFDAGILIYEGKYQNQLKVENKLYPWVIEEFLFEDKYYAKIRFPLAYQGDIKVEVKDYQAIITPLPDQTFQLVINDALDLTLFDLLLTYHAAARDTLVSSGYTHRHVVYGH